jgi:uncharacterized membrane protein YagU involved in acid resistance
MNIKIQKSILAGIAGTIVMTAVTMLAPMMGMPEMSPPKMLSAMLGTPVFVGWIMHFMIGIIFAFAYTYVCILKWKIKNVYLKGAVFGIVIFIIAQIAMAMMGANAEGSKMMMIMGSLIGHIIFGITVSKIVGDAYCANTSCKPAQ